MIVAAALVVAACGGAEETTTTAAQTPSIATTSTTEAAGDEVNIVNLSFRPADLTVAVGSTVTWTNGDGPDHTTSSVDDVWDSGVLATGETFSVVFDTPGTFEYRCNIHPRMTATITVGG